MLNFFRHFGSFIKPYRVFFVIAIVTMIFVDFSAYLLPELVRYLTDEVYPVLHNPGMLNHMILVCLILMASGLVRGIFTYIMIYCYWKVSEAVVRDIRNTLYHKIQHLELAVYDRTQVGDLMSRISNDIQLIRNFLSWGIEHRLRIILLTLSIFTLMFLLEWRLALLIYTILPGCFFILIRYSSWMREAVDRKQRQLGIFSSKIQENLTGIRVVKAFSMENREIEKFTRANKDLKDTEVRLSLLQMYLNPLLLVINGFASLCVVAFGGYLILQDRLSLGVLLGFVSYLGIMGWPISMLAMNTSQVSQATGAGKRIKEILDAPDQLKQDTGTLNKQIQGELSFEHISFAYQNDNPVLQNINFTIKPGEKVAIFGLTGAGKSTLISLFPRFYEPSTGCIRIDGTDIREWDLSSLRSQIGIVLQETFLFSASIRDNIAYGKADASMDEIMDAARHALIHDFIMSLPQQYDTLVGEYGVGLSGGQKQRIAIARTLLQDPKILILDDCTSSLDTITEHKIQMQLKDLMRGRTSIVISQRVAAFALVERIIVIDRGKLTDYASHNDLMQKDGVYRDTYLAQVAEVPAELS